MYELEMEPEKVISWITIGWFMVGFVFGAIFTFVVLVRCEKKW